MKINHPKFGVIEVTPEELVKMEMLMEGLKTPSLKKEKKAETKPYPRAYTKYPGVGRGRAKRMNRFTEDELRFVAENLHLGPTLVARHPKLAKNHSIGSTLHIALNMRNGQVDKLSLLAQKVYKEWLAEKKQSKTNPIEPTKEYLKPISAYTED